MPKHISSMSSGRVYINDECATGMNVHQGLNVRQGNRALPESYPESKTKAAWHRLMIHKLGQDTVILQ